jgi:hypothetical protein
MIVRDGWRRLGRAVAVFRREDRGGVALIFGLSATVLLGLVGGGIDYARLSYRRAQLQSAVDMGTLAGGNTLKLASSTVASVKGVTEQVVRDSAKPVPDRPFTVAVTVPDDKTSVFARVEETVKLAFGAFVGVGAQRVAAQSRASVVGKMRLCMLTLDPNAPGAFNLQKKAQVTADGCSLYSNSRNAIGMVGGDSALAKAQTICSAGGYLGPRANFSPPPQTSCPALGDPLKDRAMPLPGDCKPIPAAANARGDTSANLVNRDVTLEPGTYCGGLHVTQKAKVTLRSGIYIMKDGPLIVDQLGTLSGTDVGFYFTGDRGGLLFDQSSTVSLAAPTTGLMAGLLMAEDRTVDKPVDPTVAVINLLNSLLSILVPAPTPTPAVLGQSGPMRTYRIISDNARTMLGTIYLPVGRIVIDAAKPVADQSAYTVIVAAQVNLYEGPNLYLNANYDATSVPVPKGVGPVPGKLLLTQ